MSDLQSRFDELSADLQANRNELSSKTKQLVELQNEVGSMQTQLMDKDRQIEQLRISSKLNSQQRSDEMHLEIEAYKNQLQLRDAEKAELYNNHMGLQRQYQQLKASYDALMFKSQQNDSQYQMNTARMHSMYKQRIDSLNRMHETQSKTYENKLAAIKQEQYVLSNKETEDIVNSINELRTTHDQIESDLNAQIEDLKDQNVKREQEKERLIDDMKTLQEKANEHYESQIQELQTKLAQFEDGEVEIVLKIEVDDPVFLNKPPPKKPAPLRPTDRPAPSTIITTQHTSQHSRQSSAASSTRAQNDTMLSLSPLTADTANGNGNGSGGGGFDGIKLTLKNVESNPEFWRGDHSDPDGGHHRPKSQGSKFELPLRSRSQPDVVDGADTHHHQPPTQLQLKSDDDLDDDDEDDEGSKDSKSDEDASNHLSYQTANLTKTKSAGNAPHSSSSANKLGVGQYVSQRVQQPSNRRRRFPGHIKASRSTSSINNVGNGGGGGGGAASSSSTGKPRTPTFYIFRTLSRTNEDDGDDHAQHHDDHDEEDEKDTSEYNQSYNAFNGAATRPKSNQSSGHKYTDSALNIIKSIWTPQPRSTGAMGARRMASTPGPTYSTGGFPSTSGYRRKNSTTSVTSFNSDFFDNLSVASASSPYGMAGPGHKYASSVQLNLSPSDAIQSKSLELQKEMYRQANNRLAEDLKNANKKVMVIKQQSYRKHKQLQLQLQAEQRKWKLHDKEISEKLEEKHRLILQNEQIISSLQLKYEALQAEVNMHIQSGNGTPTAAQQQKQAQTNSIMLKLQSLEQNNKSLITELEKYRAELSRSKQTVLSCTNTMRKQQEQILLLNTKIAELRKLSGLGGSSSEELLQKQIRLLKSQRRMLVKELKDLREQNEKLKNIIVTRSIAAGQTV